MQVTETVNVTIDHGEILAVIKDYICARGYKIVSVDFDYGCSGCGLDGDETATHELIVQAVVEKVVSAKRTRNKVGGL